MLQPQPYLGPVRAGYESTACAVSGVIGARSGGSSTPFVRCRTCDVVVVRAGTVVDLAVSDVQLGALGEDVVVTHRYLLRFRGTTADRRGGAGGISNNSRTRVAALAAWGLGVPRPDRARADVEPAVDHVVGLLVPVRGGRTRAVRGILQLFITHADLAHAEVELAADLNRRVLRVGDPVCLRTRVEAFVLFVPERREGGAPGPHDVTRPQLRLLYVPGSNGRIRRRLIVGSL